MTVIIALAIAFGIASLGFPQHMATMFERMGSYSFATGYASLRYTYTGEMPDLARCVEDSLLAKSDSNVVSFGDRFISDRQAFEEYCTTRTDFKWDYRQYILGGLSVSKYRTGDSDGAIEAVILALSAVSGFPVPNAAGDLAQEIKSSDAQLKSRLYSIVLERVPSESESAYHTAVLRVLSE